MYNEEFNILIVDDTPKNLQVLGNILRDEKYKVEFALNGTKALEWTEKKRFDLILLDVMMPEMDGYEVCRIIKNDPEVKDIPIIFLTAKTDTESIVKGFETGAIDYITKPFNKNELLARVFTQLALKKASDDNLRFTRELEEKNKTITDSINYAERIQQAILPPEYHFQATFQNGFVLYRPKDIVSGDFYWIRESNGTVLFAVADCTGHGVPGAILSMLGYTGLNQAVMYHELKSPAEILQHLHQYIQYMLQKKDDDDSVMEGLDIGICILDRVSNKLEFAGAYNSLYKIRNGELSEYKSTRKTVGDISYNRFDAMDQTVEIKPGDCLYLFTDGYPDQFGGEDGKKYGYRKFRESLISVSGINCSEQRAILEKNLDEWMTEEQTDDICVMGILI